MSKMFASAQCFERKIWISSRKRICKQNRFSLLLWLKVDLIYEARKKIAKKLVTLPL